MSHAKGLWIIFLFVLSLTAFHAFGHSFKQVYQLQYDGKVYFWVGIRPNGEVLKVYPKPQTIIGHLKDKGDFESAPATADNYFPTVANVVVLRDFDESAMTIVRKLLFDSFKLQLSDSDRKEAGPRLNSPSGSFPIEVSKVKLVPVSAKEITKIEAIEKALLGTWQFTEGTSYLGDIESKIDVAEKPLPFKTKVRFCDDRECRLDGDVKKFYWVDGKFLRLSFQDDLKPESYTQSEEFDVIQASETNLIIRSVGVPFPPSLLKESGDYPKFQLYKEYQFKKDKE